MSARERAPRCTNCGYILVGVRDGPCPECGHRPKSLERWREGELHLEGPKVVTRVFLHASGAAVLMALGGIGILLINTRFLEIFEIRAQIDPRWGIVPMSIVVPVVGWLWTRPVRSRDAHLFDLHAAARWRRWLPCMVLVWWLVAVLRVADIMGSASRAAAASASGTVAVNDDTLLIVCCALGIVGQAAWILMLRHVGRVGDYLRDTSLQRIAVVWSWLWLGGMLLAPIAGGFMFRYAAKPSALNLLQAVFGYSYVGFLIGIGMAFRLLWILSDCLALAHETVARDARRAERERDRYATPE